MSVEKTANGSEKTVIGQKRSHELNGSDVTTNPKHECELRIRQRFVSHATELHYPEEPLKIVRGDGQFLYDQNDIPYLDCINNVAHVGHCNPHVVKAGSKQMGLLNTNARFLHDEIVTLAKRLVGTMPSHLTKCIFVCTGTEANDLALQMARAYTKRRDVLVLDRAYHGHSVAIMELSPYKYKAFGGKAPCDYVHIAPCPDVYNGTHQGSPDDETLADKYLDELKKVVDKASANGKEISAFFAESLQSCGGQIIYPPGYLKKAFEYVRQSGGVAIADEVQVGFGRVGETFWGFQMQDALPDIVTVGKPMGNGHPVSAVITTEEIANAFASRGITYFNTFGGNPVSCAVANAVLDVIERDNLQQHAKTLGKYWVEELRKLMNRHPIIGDVRGVGLFIGIELVKDRKTRKPASEKARKVVYEMKSRHILVSRDGMHSNVLKLKPPMVFTKEDIENVNKNLDEVLAAL